MSGNRRRWWLDALRRAAAPESGGRNEDEPGSVEAKILSANEAAQNALVGTMELLPHIADAAVKHKAMLDGASERASAMAAHAEGLTLAATRVGDAFERLSVVALNAGLEGARTQEPQGKALSLIADEIKTHAARGADTARDLVAVVEEIAGETVQLRKDLASALTAADEAGKGAAKLSAAGEKAKDALAEVERLLRRATGIDPEMSRAVANAAEHARGLASALATLRKATHAKPILQNALRPILAPLARLLSEIAEPVEKAERDEETRNKKPSPSNDDEGRKP